jgi:hypothetical protein
MPVNHYFQGGNGIGNQNEKRLYEDLIVEGLKIYGHDVYYLPRTLVNRDLILGEDTTSRFDDSWMVEMYVESTEGFAGQQEIVSKFGLEIREDTTFMVSKRAWDYHVGLKDSLIATGRPNEGDIIYYPLMNSFFEIQFVEDQEPFFALGWEYSSEKLDTGLDVIDSAGDKYTLDQLNYKFSLESGQVALDGEGSIRLEEDLSTGEPQFLMSEEFTASSIQTQSSYASNTDLDSEAGFDTSSTLDDILDFTERNPFGDEDSL